MPKDPLSTVIADLQYLVDELEALKYLIDVVPVYERPGDELSVCEHIRLIYFAQEKIISAIDDPTTNSNIQFGIQYLSEEYKRQRSDFLVEQKKGVQHYINKLIQARVGLLKTYSDNSKKLNDSTLNYLVQLIKLERAIFKEMAEKVLAINKEA